MTTVKDTENCVLSHISFTTPPLQLVSVAGSTAGSPIGVSINPAPPSGAVVSIQASSPIFYQAPAGPSSSISLVPGATAGVFTSSNLPGDPARIYNNALLAGAQSGTLNVQVQCAYSPCASPGANLAKSGSNANYTLSVTPLVPTVTQNGHAFPNIGTVLRPAYQIGSQVSLTLNMPMPVTWGYSNTFTYCCSQSTSLTGALLSGGLTAVVWATPEASFLPNTGANPYQVNIDLSAPQ